MDDLLSRVTIDPLAIKYPHRGDTASAGLAAQTSVGGCLGNLDGRVIALEGAPAASFNAVQTRQVVHPAAADFDFLFTGAPAALPKSGGFYCETGGAYGNVYVRFDGDVVYGEFAGVNFGRPCSVVGLERINGGVRFKGGAVWSIFGGVGEVDPFTGFNLTVSANF